MIIRIYNEIRKKYKDRKRYTKKYTVRQQLIILNKKYQATVFIILVLCGAVSNTFAVASNDGRMPVLYGNSFDTSVHFTYTDKSEVDAWMTTDIIRVPLVGVASIGDFLMFFGLLGFLFVLAQLFLLKRSFRCGYGAE